MPKIALVRHHPGYMLTFSRNEFRVETMRGSGPGGQKRNKTDSCVRITHIPTGLSAYNCDTPSQHRNRAAAFRVLADRLVDYYFAAPEEEARSTEEVRSYKEGGMVTDSTGFKTPFKTVMKKGMDEVIYQRKMKLEGE